MSDAAPKRTTVYVVAGLLVVAVVVGAVVFTKMERDKVTETINGVAVPNANQDAITSYRTSVLNALRTANVAS